MVVPPRVIRGGGVVCGMQCVLTARLVADDDWIHEHVRSGRWQQRRLWLGLSSGKSRKRS